MKLYDFMKEYGIPAKESKTRLNNRQVEVNGEVQGSDYELGNVIEVYDQGFFLQKLYELPNYETIHSQLMVFGLENLMSGESNIENTLTDFLKDYKMVKLSKDTFAFVKTSGESPKGDTVDIMWHLESGKETKEFELPKEKGDDELIAKLQADKAKVEKQLSNQGFVNNAPKFKVDAAKKRLEVLKKKLSELGVNEHVMDYYNFKSLNS